MVKAHGHDHLVLPQGDGVDDGGADLLRHQLVIVLHHADLGRHLDGDGTGQLQVVNLLLEAADEIGKVIGGLGILGQVGLFGVGDHLGQLHLAQLLDLQLAGQNVHGQFLHVLLVALIHLVHEADVLHQGDLMLLQGFHNLIHVDFGLIEGGLHLGHGLAGLLEQAKEALLLLGVEVQALQLHHQVAQHIAHFAQVLGADGVEGGIGKLGNVILGAAAIVHHLLGVGNIDLLREGTDSLLLGRAEHIQGQLLGRGLGLLLRRGRGFFHSGSGGRLGIQGQGGDVALLFVHLGSSFLIRPFRLQFKVLAAG